MDFYRALSVVSLALVLAACSDSTDTPPPVPPEPPPPPISIVTPDADRCEILDAVNCMFPWPSDAFTVADDNTDTGLRVNLVRESLPANKQGVRVDPAEWNRNDGFSPSQMILTQIPGVDLEQTGAPLITDLEASLEGDSPVVVIRASTGEQHLVFAELDANTDDPAEQTFIIRPMVQFERGERYIVALRNLRDSAGETLPAPEVFRALRDATITDNDVIEGRRPVMEALFTELEDAGIARDELYLAWDFTIASTRNITERILHIRDEAFADLGGAAPSYLIQSITDFAPCVEGACQAGEDAQIAREVAGTYLVPGFLDTADGAPGSAFHYDEPNDGLPDRLNGTSTFVANFICRIPRSVAEDFSAAPKAVARPSLYGHGLLGSAREVRGGTRQNVDIMADDHQMMFCATDWSGFAGEDAGFAINVLQDFSLINAFFDRQQQGLLNFMFLARLLKHDAGFVADPAFRAQDMPVFDNSTVFYDGNSQGGILGGALMGVIQDVTRGVLGVPGMSYSFLLRRSVDFEAFKPFFSGSGTGDTGGGYPSIKDQSFLLSMAQMLWDRAESSGYVHHIEREVLPNTPSHAVLLQVAFGDHQVSMWSAEFMARTIGAKLRIPATETGRHPDSNPYVALEPVPTGDFTGSVITIWDDGPLGGGAIDGGTAPPPVTNTPPFEPDFGEDPHSLPRREPAAQLQKSGFLRPDGVGKFVDTCPPDLPCTTNGYVPGG
ncbi:hypothetical protein CWI75_15905 [Kineobactrum sediminis]|uniref:Bacterial virulence factor lipase N-terminal domain-containing protein n=1 Tax=Kineobactrum sediminis TaxID=1905677 RepID=A0A2N5XYU1_9GAMM|nr:hypothetical protein [Kineobactrum sediminis]PLW81317.1 hypothetical protein CWI75_15905 [Kineobactrum sediminis]